MIGVVVYKLRALRTGSLPAFHGRQLHGALFKLIQSYSPDMSSYIHDKMNIKPFAISLLEKGDLSANPFREKQMMINENECFYWRVSGLDDDILRAELSLPRGTILHINSMEFLLEDVYADGSHNSGVVDEEALLTSIFSQTSVREVTFHFPTLVTFRRDKVDYPVADPMLIFGSLVDKWLQAGMPGEVDRQMIRNLAQQFLVPKDWSGRTFRVSLGFKRGVIGFQGYFTFDISELHEEARKVFMLLAQFSEFAGVGRLTAQGLGQSRIKWK